jgi:hypothetical protein
MKAPGKITLDLSTALGDYSSSSEKGMESSL